jgi:hypothetical protein
MGGLEEELLRKTRFVREESYHGFAEPFHGLVVRRMYRSPSAKSRNGSGRDCTYSPRIMNQVTSGKEPVCARPLWVT